MKRMQILLVGMGFMACVAGESRLEAASPPPKVSVQAVSVQTTGGSAVIKTSSILAHPDYDDLQKAKMLQAMEDEEKRLLMQPGANPGKSFIPGSRIGDMGFILPSRKILVFRVVDEWNCILKVFHHSNIDEIQYIWLEDYPTADIFTDDWVKIVGKLKVVDGEETAGMPGLYGDTNLTDKKVRVVRLMSPEEQKNPAVYDAREVKEKVRKAESAGDESAKDKALRRPWTINGNREWAIFDGVKSGQVNLRVSRINPMKRVVEETVKTYVMTAFSKEDQAWIDEMLKD